MSDLRVYVVIGTFQPIVGGAEKQAFIQARSLRERGYAATVMTFRHNKAWPSYEVIEGIPVIRVAGSLLGDRKKLPRLLQKAFYVLALVVMAWRLWQQRQCYNILHVYQLSLLAWPTALVCWLTGKAIVISVRGADKGSPINRDDAKLLAGPLDPRTPWLRARGIANTAGDLQVLEQLGSPFVRFTHALLHHVDAGIVILSSYMRYYLATHKFTFANTRLIPNGVDIHRFTPTYTDVSFVERANVVICVARLDFHKGIDVLLQAWYLVQKQCPQARLIIVGTGPIQRELGYLRQELGLLESVEFADLQHDVPTQLSRAGIFVLPSRWEGMPNALLEAMACGLACVATRVSGSEDIISHGNNGLLVKPEDYQEMAEALLSLLQDPTLAQNYGQAARLTVEQCYPLDRMMDSYINFYQEIAKKRGLSTI